MVWVVQLPFPQPQPKSLSRKSGGCVAWQEPPRTCLSFEKNNRTENPTTANITITSVIKAISNIGIVSIYFVIFNKSKLQHYNTNSGNWFSLPKNYLSLAPYRFQPHFLTAVYFHPQARRQIMVAYSYAHLITIPNHRNSNQTPILLALA